MFREKKKDKKKIICLKRKEKGKENIFSFPSIFIYIKSWGLFIGSSFCVEVCTSLSSMLSVQSILTEAVYDSVGCYTVNGTRSWSYKPNSNSGSKVWQIRVMRQGSNKIICCLNFVSQIVFNIYRYTQKVISCIIKQCTICTEGV